MANTTIAKIREGLILDSVDLGLYLQEKAKYHKNYKYYSSKQTIQSICETNSILLSDGENWNDEADKERMRHKRKSPRYFGFCFSYSISENVAMWMLYSQDNGCMIDFDRNSIESIMNVYDVEIGELINGKFNPLDKLVVKDAGIKIQLSDVIYVGKTDDEKKNDEFYYVRRSSETNSEFNKKLIEDEFLFRKGLPWFYEN